MFFGAGEGYLCLPSSFLCCVLADIISFCNLLRRGISHCGSDLGKAVTRGHAPREIAVAQNIERDIFVEPALNKTFFQAIAKRANLGIFYDSRQDKAVAVKAFIEQCQQLAQLLRKRDIAHQISAVQARYQDPCSAALGLKPLDGVFNMQRPVFKIYITLFQSA